jgi:hypothetical protein
VNEKAPAVDKTIVPPRLGGWLTVFQIVIVLMTGGFLVGFRTASADVAGVALLLPVGGCLLNLVGLAAIATKRRWTRVYWLIVLAVYAALMAYVWAQTNQQSLFNGTVANVVWWVYWLRSRRVRQRFARVE